MEHGYIIDQNVQTYVGWEASKMPILDKYYSRENVTMISNKISQLLQGVDVKNRKIVVPNHLIINVMTSVQQKYRPSVGDIYTRYNVVPEQPEDTYQKWIDITIETIVSQVRNMFGMQEANSKLSIWTSVLGDFNPHGLRQYTKIYTREKRPTPLQIHMHY